MTVSFTKAAAAAPGVDAVVSDPEDIVVDVGTFVKVLWVIVELSVLDVDPDTHTLD